MRTLLSLTAMLGLVGCVGGLEAPSPNPGDDEPTNPNPNPPPPAGSARLAYEQDVLPVLDAKCKSCHTDGATAGGAPATSGFVGKTVATAYDVMIDHPGVHGNFAATAKVLTYVTLQGHQGLAYETTEIASIENWLATELAERGDGGGTTGPEGPGQTTERILNTFSACMTQELFDQANMAQSCGQMQSSNNTECDNCHVNGGENFLASRVSTQMFKGVSEHRSYLQKYFMVANAETPATAKMDRNIPTFMAVLGRTGQYTEHPQVENGTPENNTCTQAMTTLLGLVQARIDAGAAACGPSKLVD